MHSEDSFSGHELSDRAAMRRSFLDFDVMNCEPWLAKPSLESQTTKK